MSDPLMSMVMLEEDYRLQQKESLAHRVAQFHEIQWQGLVGSALHGVRRRQREALAARVEEFYNKHHQQSGEDGGQFVEGPDGPGRIRDNAKKPGRGPDGVPLNKKTSKPDTPAEPETSDTPPAEPKKTPTKPDTPPTERKKLTSKQHDQAFNDFYDVHGRGPKSVEELQDFFYQEKKQVTETVNGKRQVKAAHGKEPAGNVMADLTQKERNALEAYRESSVDENDYLRAGRKPTSGMKALDAVIAKSEAAEDIKTYRGQGATSSKRLSDIRIGESFTDAAYTSTSTSKVVADRFQGGKGSKTFTFLIPKGGSVLAVGGVEAEILVARDATWVKTGPNEFTLKI